MFLVEIGRHQVAVRVSVTVRPQMPNLTRLLVVSTPFSKFSTSDATTFAPWLEEVSEGHLDAHYVEVHAERPCWAKSTSQKSTSSSSAWKACFSSKIPTPNS